MKSLIWVLVSQILFSCSLWGKATINDTCQSEYDTLAKKKVYTYVDRMPEYPGGNIEILKFITSNFKYPEQDDFQGSFQIEFVIDIDGKLIAARIKDKQSASLTKAEVQLLKVINKLPKWQAGKCFGKNVPVKMILPLRV
jgi:hypothetical protein